VDDPSVRGIFFVYQTVILMRLIPLGRRAARPIAFALGVWLAGGSTCFAGVIAVPAGGDLQAALNRAAPGDLITLAPGATYSGNFVLPVKQGDAIITLRTDSSAGGLPQQGQRISPDHSPLLAKLQSPTNLPVLNTAPGAHHWRIELLEFLPNRGGQGDIIALGDGSTAQSSLSQVPHDLAMDRCYIHGDPATGQKRGISLNSARTNITGSYISDIKALTIDSQAIAGWNGPGPFRIDNNHLEAAGEVFLLGGSTPGIRDLVPSDVVFTRNYVTRPTDWRNEKWQIKNLFELKNARRVLVERNLFENNWVAAQAGYAIVLTPRGEQGKAAWAVVEDITFRLNIVRHVAAAINILGHDDGGPSGLARLIRVTQNLFYDVNGRNWGGNGFFLLIGDGPSDIIIDHNTIVQTGNVIEAYGAERGAPVPINNFVFRDNIAFHNSFGVHGASRSTGNDTLQVFFPGVIFENNILAGGRATLYPAGNFFPTNGELQDQFVSMAQDDYRLRTDSRYRRASSEGDAIGAPIEQLAGGLPRVIDRQRPQPAVIKRNGGG
jgi:hypothetical protein